MHIKKFGWLDSLARSAHLALVVFVSIIGILGIVFMYAPDNVVSALYLGAVYSAFVMWVGKCIEFRMKS
jgi:cytochrome b561